ncbi:hypothetical protein AD47_5343, partial [Escherichia coli 6-319-05_S4_C3]
RQLNLKQQTVTLILVDLRYAFPMNKASFQISANIYIK